MSLCDGGWENRACLEIEHARRGGLGEVITVGDLVESWRYSVS